MNSAGAYESHTWTWGWAGGPADAYERVCLCSECGCENAGDPAEFPELEYPPCGPFADEDA